MLYFTSILFVIVLILIIWRIVIPISRKRRQYIAEGKQALSLLRQHPNFSAQKAEYSVEVDFHYAESTEENLTKLREQYDLDTIAGQGSEIDQIINLMRWAYSLAKHANEPIIPADRNALTFIELAQVKHQQLNCYMKTVILNEVYLAMGFRSRRTHLLPHSHEERESHFITSVYSRTLKKWILMDPDFGVYVTDENGNMLDVMEIRHRLISGAPLKVQSPGESRLKIAWDSVRGFLESADYFWFLSQFIFKMRCPKYSVFGQGSQSLKEHFELIPDGYQPELLQEPRLNDRGQKIYFINDEHLLWQ